jgi:hypothetical protein
MKELNETKNAHAKQNHNKSGKQEKRRELRRLEAISRQVTRIEKAEKNALKAKDKAEAQRKIDKAKLTLIQIRGGTPHQDPTVKAKAVAVEPDTNPR